MGPISDVMNRIRGLVNEPRRLHKLFAERIRWGQLCASMDAVDDVDLALTAHLQGRPETASDGENYIIVYGVLQLLYVQQDATKHLGTCVGINVTFDSEVWDVRDIRNAAIGHPTNYENKRSKLASHNFIVRHSLSRGGFTLMRVPPQGDVIQQNVDLADIIAKQREKIALILREATDAMEKEELEHRRKHRGIKLTSPFSGTIHHGFEKIQEWVSSNDTGMGQYGVDVVRKAVAKFRGLLSDRGILEVYEDSVLREIQETEYVLTRLQDCLDGKAPQLTNDDRAVYFHSLRCHVETLRKDHGEPLDAEYASDEV